MFIAFKWLVGMAMIMWLAMCSLDFYVNRNRNDSTGLKKPFECLFQNKVILNIAKSANKSSGVKISNDYQHMVMGWHWLLFGFGALLLLLYSHEEEIISQTYLKIISLNWKQIIANVNSYLKFAAILISIAILKYSRILSGVLKRYYFQLRLILSNLIKSKKYSKIINVSVLQKLKEANEEQKLLGNLLISAIHENKIIRMQYQLESMARNRLIRHISDTQKQIKENRTKYISFQQLYLITSQENMFLRSRLFKVTKEKNDVEKNLLALMNKIYKSRNNELKTYCSRFIVKTKDSLLNSDVNSEIQKFLQKPVDTKTTVISQLLNQSLTMSDTIHWQRPDRALITDIVQNDCLLPVVSNAPKLKGLPGECIWTIKDKHGIIEKLYEYDYESAFDKGETIRRIREYTVYHDKDCLLDFTRSKTAVYNNYSETTGDNWNVNYSISTQKFLTGSRAFKHFLQTNKNIVPARSTAIQFRL